MTNYQASEENSRYLSRLQAKWMKLLTLSSVVVLILMMHLISGIAKHVVRITFLDNITYQLETRFDKKSRICAELLVLTPTISASNKFDPTFQVANMLTWECHLPCPVQLQNEMSEIILAEKSRC